MEINDNNKSKSKEKEQLLQSLKEKHGQIINFEGEFQGITLDLYFKDGEAPHLQRYMSTVAKDSLRAGQNLIKDLLVHPEMSQLKEHLDKYPGLVLAISNEISEQLGMAVDFFVKRV